MARCSSAQDCSKTWVIIAGIEVQPESLRKPAVAEATVRVRDLQKWLLFGESCFMQSTYKLLRNQVTNLLNKANFLKDSYSFGKKFIFGGTGVGGWENGVCLGCPHRHGG